MNVLEIKKRAQEKVERRLALEGREDVQRVLGLLAHLELLRGETLNTTDANATVTVEEMILAAEAEPRVFELMPAVVALCDRVVFQEEELPPDLFLAVRAIREGNDETHAPAFKWVEAKKYLHWANRLREKLGK